MEFVGRDSKKKHKILVRIVGVPAEIETEHFFNTSLERYRYANLLFPPFYDVEDPLSSSQEPAIGPYLQPHEYSSQHRILFL